MQMAGRNVSLEWLHSRPAASNHLGIREPDGAARNPRYRGLSQLVVAVENHGCPCAPGRPGSCEENARPVDVKHVDLIYIHQPQKRVDHPRQTASEGKHVASAFPA